MLNPYDVYSSRFGCMIKSSMQGWWYNLHSTGLNYIAMLKYQKVGYPDKVVGAELLFSSAQVKR